MKFDQHMSEYVYYIYLSKNILTAQTTGDVTRSLPVKLFHEIRPKKVRFSGEKIGCRLLSQQIIILATHSFLELVQGNIGDPLH